MTIPSLQLRKYQQLVVIQAQERNTIAYLPTGSGKTLIACHLIRNQLEPLRILREKQPHHHHPSPNSEWKKIIVFIAPTRALLFQQIEYIKLHAYPVKTFCALGREGARNSQVEMEIEVEGGYSGGRDSQEDVQWKGEEIAQWKKLFCCYEVIGMTPEVLRRLLEFGIVPIQTIHMIVFDECHHVGANNHPMGRLCDTILACRKIRLQNNLDADQPTADEDNIIIFGMTASPIQSKNGGGTAFISEKGKKTKVENDIASSSTAASSSSSSSVLETIRRLESRMQCQFFYPSEEFLLSLQEHRKLPNIFALEYKQMLPFRYEIEFLHILERLEKSIKLKEVYTQEQQLHHDLIKQLLADGQIAAYQYYKQYVEGFEKIIRSVQLTVDQVRIISQKNIVSMKEGFHQVMEVMKFCGIYCGLRSFSAFLRTTSMSFESTPVRLSVPVASSNIDRASDRQHGLKRKQEDMTNVFSLDAHHVLEDGEVRTEIQEKVTIRATENDQNQQLQGNPAGIQNNPTAKANMPSSVTGTSRTQQSSTGIHHMTHSSINLDKLLSLPVELVHYLQGSASKLYLLTDQSYCIYFSILESLHFFCCSCSENECSAAVSYLRSHNSSASIINNSSYGEGNGAILDMIITVMEQGKKRDNFASLTELISSHYSPSSMDYVAAVEVACDALAAQISLSPLLRTFHPEPSQPNELTFPPYFTEKVRCLFQILACNQSCCLALNEEPDALRKTESMKISFKIEQLLSEIPVRRVAIEDNKLREHMKQGGFEINQSRRRAGYPSAILVFCSLRMTAQVLHQLIEDVVTPSIGGGCERDLVLYKSGSLDGGVSMACQRKTLKRLKEREINLLFVTDIAQEGIDIPSCNMIINFDNPQTPIGFIQRRGRARSPASLLIHLVKSLAPKQKDSELKDILHFIQQELLTDQMIKSIYQEEPMPTIPTDLLSSTSEPADLIDSSFPSRFTVSHTGISVDSFAAKSLLDQYCSNFLKCWEENQQQMSSRALKDDIPYVSEQDQEYFINFPRYLFERLPTTITQWRVRLMLPDIIRRFLPDCPVFWVEGSFTHNLSKNYIKGLAALQAIQFLFEKGEFDKHLRFRVDPFLSATVPSIPSDDPLTVVDNSSAKAVSSATGAFQDIQICIKTKKVCDPIGAPTVSLLRMEEGGRNVEGKVNQEYCHGFQQDNSENHATCDNKHHDSSCSPADDMNNNHHHIHDDVDVGISQSMFQSVEDSPQFYLYRIEIVSNGQSAGKDSSTEAAIESNSKLLSQIEAFQSMVFCFLFPLPTTIFASVYEMFLKGFLLSSVSPLTPLLSSIPKDYFRLIFLGARVFSAREMSYIQIFHKSVIGLQPFLLPQDTGLQSQVPSSSSYFYPTDQYDILDTFFSRQYLTTLRSNSGTQRESDSPNQADSKFSVIAEANIRSLIKSQLYFPFDDWKSKSDGSYYLVFPAPLGYRNFDLLPAITEEYLERTAKQSILFMNNLLLIEENNIRSFSFSYFNPFSVVSSAAYVPTSSSSEGSVVAEDSAKWNSKEESVLDHLKSMKKVRAYVLAEVSNRLFTTNGRNLVCFESHDREVLGKHLLDPLSAASTSSQAKRANKKAVLNKVHCFADYFANKSERIKQFILTALSHSPSTLQVNLTVSGVTNSMSELIVGTGVASSQFVKRLLLEKGEEYRSSDAPFDPAIMYKGYPVTGKLTLINTLTTVSVTNETAGGPEKSQRNASASSLTSEVQLLPQLCQPIGNLQYYQIALLFPSLSHRIHSILLAQELYERYYLPLKTFPIVETKQPPNFLEPCTTTGISSMGASKKLKVEEAGTTYRPCFLLPKKDAEKPFFIQIADVLRAITPRRSLECIDSERLELLGDCFLKYAATLFVYFEDPLRHEGIMSAERRKYISNFYLKEVAIASGVSQYLRGSPLSRGLEEVLIHPPGQDLSLQLPKTRIIASDETESTDKGVNPMDVEQEENNGCFHWQPSLRNKNIFLPASALSQAADSAVPPTQTTRDQQKEEKYETISINAKSLADIVESLVGVCVIPDLQEDIGMAFLYSLKVLPRSFEKTNGMLESFPFRYVRNIDGTLSISNDGYVSAVKAASNAQGNEQWLFSGTTISQIEQVIGYTFRSKELLCLAFTQGMRSLPLPSSYSIDHNNKPSAFSSAQIHWNYQRLEFLGDAVLDYLVVRYLFHISNSTAIHSTREWSANANPWDEGELTTLKHFFTVNEILCRVTCHLQLYTFIQTESLELSFKLSSLHRATVDSESTKDDPHDHYPLTNNTKKIRLDMRTIITHHISFQQQQKQSETVNDRTEVEQKEEKKEEEAKITDDYEFTEDYVHIKILADVFEALVGAVFIDCDHNLTIVHQVLCSLGLFDLTYPQLQQLLDLHLRKATVNDNTVQIEVK